ncbi:hypothetical protein LZK98_11715 [Sphingomonas cannabina]|uniref:hypothetical protein n=1 Tax=Sphingomonas cannabina TaxID=2899123 RepID=UPI001F2F4751|nr:hypothetical protein [Sphingomonas cannabina]UIJ43758.1 hypothetical protein LZK98_11715 [Sphingomonas cannabina]
MQTTVDTRQLVVAPQSAAAEKFALAQRQARTFAMSPLVPEHLRKGSPEQAIANCYIALTLAEAMGEMPLIVMQNIHVINGKAGFASKYMIARANASGKFKDDLDWEIAGAGKTLSATCFATLAKSGKRVEMTVDMAMAEAEGWTKNAKYRTMPELMLRYRSASFLVNLYAPEVMLGYRTVEEIEDVAIAAAVDVQPLTAAMIEHQAAPAEEVVEPEQEEASEGSADTDRGEDHNDTLADHPARQLADDLTARCVNAAILGDALTVESDLRKHRDAMPEELVAAVEKEITAAKERFGKAKS